MSVYRPRKNGEFTSPFYHFDFQCGGVRFSGSTATADRREAERVERQKRKEAEQAIARNEAIKNKPMTLYEACARYWTEVGQHAGTSSDIWSYLRNIERLLGRDTPLAKLTSSVVSNAVARRRAETVPQRSKKKRKGSEPRQLISAATVNRTFTEPLRRILRRAKEVWGEDVPSIGWKDLILPEPKERIREASHAEEAKLIEALRDDYRPAIEFMLVTGCRLEEVIRLSWDRVLWTAGVIRIVGKGKRGSPDQERLIPITDSVHDILWPLRHHHGEAVFTYIAQRNNASRWVKQGDHVPITYEGLKTLWQRTRDAAGLKDLRLHDTRHTALTRLVRETGNLKLAQKLAGHSDINTTAKYAHADVADLRAGMERVAKSTTPEGQDGRKWTNRK